MRHLMWHFGPVVACWIRNLEDLDLNPTLALSAISGIEEISQNYLGVAYRIDPLFGRAAIPKFTSAFNIFPRVCYAAFYSPV